MACRSRQTKHPAGATMIEHDSLSSLLLLRWQNHRPAFLGRLQASNQLNAALCETRDRMADLLYDPDRGTETGAPSGLGVDDRAVPSFRRASLEIEPVTAPSRDFRIMRPLIVSGRAACRKRPATISRQSACSSSLKRIDREATGEEKAILARYVGWGAMSKAFDRWPLGGLERHRESAQSPSIGGRV